MKQGIINRRKLQGIAESSANSPFDVERIQNAFDMFYSAQIEGGADPAAAIAADSQKLYGGKVIFSKDMVSDHFLPL